jgi:hypothetical protein
MQSIYLETTIESDGELRLFNLPCHKGDRVEAVLILRQNPDEEQRNIAIKEIIDIAKKSAFCSKGPYPSREELHERN